MFYSDKPIVKAQEDVLNRKYFARLMAKTLVDFESDDTFTIGLYGRWGNGKTSLVNMMLQEVREYQKGQEKLIIVRFDPWNFSSTDQLLDQFFVRLRNVFRDSKDEKLEKVGDAIEVYSGALKVVELLPYVGGALSFVAQRGAVSFAKRLKNGSDEKDILKQKENVIKLLENQEKRILIVIDDIDRLNNEQIRQIFQLITSVAKFPNTTYLLVFDKEIVVRALEKVQEGSGEEYLEKIIQMPIQIPDIQKVEFRKVLISRLDKMLAENEGVLFEESYWQRMFDSCVEPLIKNMRDINRLCNTIQFKLSALSTEVNFTDLLIISAIEIAYPGIFNWIKKNKSALTGENVTNILSSKGTSQQERYDSYFSEIKDIIENNRGNNTIKSVKIFLEILVRLFPYFGNRIGLVYETYDLNVFRKNNRIAHPEKFDRYFNLNIDYVTLKTSDIANAINELNSDDLAIYIIGLDKEDASYDFLEEIRAVIEELNDVRAKEIIKAIFKCAYKLDMVTYKSVLSNSSRNYAEHLVLPLFDIIEKEKRMAFWSELLSEADLNSLPPMAEVINMLELAYGRLAANGQERGYEKVITLDELVCLEKLFADKVKGILDKNSIFDFTSYRMILYLMENYEPQFTENRMNSELQENRNVLLYLSSTISTWIGNGISYEINKEYEKRLTREHILDVIQQEKETKKLFELPIDNQRLCVAFYMNENGNTTSGNDISQKKVDELLEEWKNEQKI